jgi:RND family efflux transporter MFP subunit
VSDLQKDLASLHLPVPGQLTSRRRRRWPWFLLLVVLIAGAFSWRVRTRAVEVKTVPPSLETATNTAGSPVLTAAGFIVARRRAVVSAKIQGRLADLKVEEGARVRQGEVFARLESADFEAALLKSKAALARADAQITSAQAAVTSSDALVARGEADAAEMRRQLGVAERLLSEKITPIDQVDAARSRVRMAEAALGQARADAGRARAEVVRVTAEREQAQADVAFNEAQLQNTYIRAPFTGTVVKKMAEVGESVAPIPPGVNISTASGAIVALADLDTLEVEVDVAEANVAGLSDGQLAEVIVEAFPSRKYRASLRQVIPTADRTRATVMVKVTILDKDLNLKPEMSAKVTFLAPASAQDQSEGQVLLVPESAVVPGASGSSVFVVVDGRAKTVPVVLGAKRQGRVVVAEGLSGGEAVIAQPPVGLVAGSRVRVKEGA